MSESIDLDIKPFELAVSKYFTLAKNSQIEELYLKQLKQDKHEELKPIEEAEESKEMNISSPNPKKKREPLLDLSEVRDKEDDQDNEKSLLLESGDVGGSNYKHLDYGSNNPTISPPRKISSKLNTPQNNNEESPRNF